MHSEVLTLNRGHDCIFSRESIVFSETRLLNFHHRS